MNNSQTDDSTERNSPRSAQCGSGSDQHKDVRSWNGRKVECCLSCGTILVYASHVYKALNLAGEFRLLELFPGDRESDLSGELHHFRIDDCPPYEAVSYTWGDQYGVVVHTGQIQIRSSGNLLSITTNCDAALRRIRDSQTSRMIWVDSICIDQENLLERSEQVELMTKLYSGAKQVLAYLGAPSDSKFQDYKELFDYIRTSNRDYESKTNNETVGKGAISNLLRPKSVTEKRLLHVLLQFFAYPWFHRIWIVQEVIMAESLTILFGDLVLDWEELMLEHLETPPSQTRPFDFEKSGSASIPFSAELERRIPPVLCIRRDAKSRRYGLIDLLFATQRCAAGDPRDKVYALFGMARRDEKISLPKIRYDHSVQSIFEEATLYCIETSKSLEILYLCDQHNQSAQGNMSWVPNFADTASRVRLPPHEETLPPCGRIIPQRFGIPIHGPLPAQGMEVDTILGVQNDVATIARIRAAQPRSLLDFVMLLKELFPELILHPFFLHTPNNEDLCYWQYHARPEPRVTHCLEIVEQLAEVGTHPEDMEAIDLLADRPRYPWRLSRLDNVSRRYDETWRLSGVKKVSRSYNESLDLLAPFFDYHDVVPPAKRRRVRYDPLTKQFTEFCFCLPYQRESWESEKSSERSSEARARLLDSLWYGDALQPKIEDSVFPTTLYRAEIHPVFKELSCFEDTLLSEGGFVEGSDDQREEPKVKPPRDLIEEKANNRINAKGLNDPSKRGSQQAKKHSKDVQISTADENVEMDPIDCDIDLPDINFCEDVYNASLPRNVGPAHKNWAWCACNIQMFFHWIRLYAEGRAVYYGKKTVGIGPLGTQKKDSVCILNSISRSVILDGKYLRPWNDAVIRGPCTSLTSGGPRGGASICPCGHQFREEDFRNFIDTTREWHPTDRRSVKVDAWFV